MTPTTSAILDELKSAGFAVEWGELDRHVMLAAKHGAETWIVVGDDEEHAVAELARRVGYELEDV